MEVVKEANCQLAVTARSCGDEDGPGKSVAGPKELGQVARGEQTRRKRRSPA